VATRAAGTVGALITVGAAGSGLFAVGRAAALGTTTATLFLRAHLPSERPEARARWVSLLASDAISGQDWYLVH